MSEIKVNSIKGVGASAAAITVNNSDGTCTANITNKPNRNLIINGAMQVAQRGTSSTSSGMHSVDRFTVNSSGGGVTQAQISEQSGTVFENGFCNYLRLTNTSNTTTDTDYRFIGQTIEAQNVANSGWNFKSASSFVTLSFWVRSSLAGTYYGWLNSRDGTNKTFTFSFTLSANTWTKVTKTISGNSGIDIHNNIEEGLIVHVIPWYGTYYTTSGHTLDAWQTSSSTDRTPDYQQNWANTSNATFDLTGVQLEVGNVATDFEHKSFGQELALCQRYYYQIAPAVAESLIGTTVNHDSVDHCNLRFPVEMRAEPSLVVSNFSNAFRIYGSSGGRNVNTLSLNTGVGSNKAVQITSAGGTSGSVGFVRVYGASGGAYATIAVSSEV